MKFFAAILAATLVAIPVFASDAIIVDHTMDFFVVVTEPTRLEVRTELCDLPEVLWCGGHFTDSVLWLYDENGTEIYVNDDNGVSWASVIAIDLEAGFYRLRAGRFLCDSDGCLHPEAPFPTGGFYSLFSNLPLILDPNPPVASPDPIPSNLPTPTQTPTEEPTIEPSIDPTPSPTPDPSQSLDPSPSPTETPAPTPSPTHRPTPSPASPSPSPSPSESVVPTPIPSADSTPSNSPDPVTITTVEEAVAAVSKAVGEAVDATVGRITRLGQDLTPVQKENARPVAVAIIVSQAASSAVAIALSKRSSK